MPRENDDEQLDEDRNERVRCDYYRKVAKQFRSRRRKLSNAERAVLLELAKLSQKADSLQQDKVHVVDLAIPWPLCHRHKWFFGHSPKTMWPADYGARSYFDVGMWSLLPVTSFGKYGRHFTTPMQYRLERISSVLDFCDEVRGYVTRHGGLKRHEQSPQFFIESTATLVASCEFDSQSAASEWVVLIEQCLGAPAFLECIKSYDTKHGIDRWVNPKYSRTEWFYEDLSSEEEFFWVSDYPRPLVQISFNGVLPKVSMTFDQLEEIARASHYRRGDQGALALMAGLWSRGYIRAFGERKSYEFRSFVPEYIALTGTGYQRTMDILRRSGLV